MSCSVGGFHEISIRGAGQSQVRVRQRHAEFDSLSRRSLLLLAAPAFVGPSALFQPRLGLARQLADDEKKSVAAWKAITWFNAREDGLITRGQVISNTTDEVKKAVKLNHFISLTIGHGLAKRKRAYQVWIYSDDFFAFPLSNEQEARLDIGEYSIRSWSRPRQKETTDLPLAAELQSLNISNTQALPGSAKITGSVMCQKLRDVKADYAFRLSYATSNVRVEKWTYLPKEQVPPDGVVSFTFAEVNPSDKEKPLIGLIPMFLTLTTLKPREQNEAQVEETLHSNTVGTMVDVVAG
jgi:hypothetical protein